MLRRFAPFALVFAASAAGAMPPDEKKPAAPGKCDGLFDMLEERQREALKGIVGELEAAVARGEMTREDIEEAVLRHAGIEQHSVIGPDPEGFAAKIENLYDAQFYQSQIMDGIWVNLRERIFDPQRTKIFYHALGESKIFPKPLVFRLNGFPLVYQNRGGRNSARTPALIHHLQAAVTTVSYTHLTLPTICSV